MQKYIIVSQFDIHIHKLFVHNITYWTLSSGQAFCMGLKKPIVVPYFFPGAINCFPPNEGRLLALCQKSIE